MNQLLEQDQAAFRSQTQAIHAQYLAQTETAVADGAKIILWPELAGLGLAEDVQTLLSQGQALAQRHQSYLAMPTMTLSPMHQITPPKTSYSWLALTATSF